MSTSASYHADAAPPRAMIPAVVFNDIARKLDDGDPLPNQWIIPLAQRAHVNRILRARRIAEGR